MNLTTWQWLFSHLKPHRSSIVTLLGVSAVFGLVEIATPLILQRLIDTAAAGTYDVWLTSGLIGLFVASSIPLPYWLQNRLLARFTYKLRGELLHTLLRMDMSFHDDRGSTILATEATKGVNAAGNLLNLLTNNQILLQLPIGIFAVFYMGQHSLSATVILLLFLVVFGICSKYVGKKISTEEEAYQEIDNELTHRSREAVQQIQTVKVNNATAHELDHYWREGMRAVERRFRLINLNGMFAFLGGGAHSFAIGVVAVSFLPPFARGEISSGTFFALLIFASRIVAPAEFLGEFYAEIKKASALLKPVMVILENKPQVVEQTHPLQLNPVQDAIEVRNVSFRYPGKDRDILKAVSLTIPSRRKTAIVGRSGSGKTTLARLLTRLYDPTGGIITFDGTDLRNLSFDSLYEQVSYLTQEVPLFTGTISDNVAYGLKDYQTADIDHALLSSSAHFVSRLQEGQKTKVGEMGKKLSGGERQRIAIARLFMRNPSVIILDEATSALDTITEAEVHRTFEELGKLNSGKTMIIIAHRLSTVQNADQIVVMDDGRVLDVGTHAELLARCAFYQELNKTLSTS